MLINQFTTFLSNKSVFYLFAVIDDSSVKFFVAYHLLRIICLYLKYALISSKNEPNLRQGVVQIEGFRNRDSTVFVDFFKKIKKLSATEPF